MPQLLTLLLLLPLQTPLLLVLLLLLLLLLLVLLRLPALTEAACAPASIDRGRVRFLWYGTRKRREAGEVAPRPHSVAHAADMLLGNEAWIELGHAEAEQRR